MYIPIVVGRYTYLFRGLNAEIGNNAVKEMREFCSELSAYRLGKCRPRAYLHPNFLFLRRQLTYKAWAPGRFRNFRMVRIYRRRNMGMYMPVAGTCQVCMLQGSEQIPASLDQTLTTSALSMITKFITDQVEPLNFVDISTGRQAGEPIRTKTSCESHQ